MIPNLSIGGFCRIQSRRSAAPVSAFFRRGIVPSRSSPTDCADSRRAGGPSMSGALSFPQGREAWSFHVVHTHKIAGSNPAPATRLPVLKWMPRSCGPP